MSYMTGLALGLSAGKQLYNIWHNESDNVQKEGFILIHATPGRRRYQNTKLQQDAEFCRFVAYYLPLMRRIVSCEVNELSGTVLIHFQADDYNYVETGLHLLECLYKQKAPYGQTGMKVRGAVGGLNRTIRKKTGEMLDLKTLVAAWMFFQGTRKCLMQGQNISGPNLLWWSYSLMKGSGR